MAEITEAKVYQAFGLETPTVESGANTQEVAAPAEGNMDANSSKESTTAQEVTEPGDNGMQEIHAAGDEPGETGDNGTEPVERGVQVQTLEQRRENAARRRQMEQQAAIDAAVRAEKEKAAATMKDLFARVGMKNTFTGEPITNMEEFTTWDQQYKADKLQKDLEAGKLTKESLDAAISEHPIVKQAAQVVQNYAQEQKQQADAAFQAKVDGEIAQIGKLDPSIKSVGDLLNMANAKEFYDKVAQGYSFYDAYRLVNFEKITAANAEAAKRQAQANSRGKEHLNPVGNTRGGGAVSVPGKVMAYYRALNPNASEADIQANYNKYVKQGG